MTYVSKYHGMKAYGGCRHTYMHWTSHYSWRWKRICIQWSLNPGGKGPSRSWTK